MVRHNLPCRGLCYSSSQSSRLNGVLEALKPTIPSFLSVFEHSVLGKTGYKNHWPVMSRGRLPVFPSFLVLLPCPGGRFGAVVWHHRKLEEDLEQQQY